MEPQTMSRFQKYYYAHRDELLVKDRERAKSYYQAHREERKAKALERYYAKKASAQTIPDTNTTSVDATE